MDLVVCLTWVCCVGGDSTTFVVEFELDYFVYVYGIFRLLVLLFCVFVLILFVGDLLSFLGCV